MEYYYVREPYLGIHMPPVKKVSSDPERNDLSERTKELKCLYGAFKLFNSLDRPLDKTLQEVVDLLPSGWQFSEITCAMLTLEDKAYFTECYLQSEWKLSANIVVNKENVGVLEVAYRERRPECYRGPFLEEEVFLLEAFANLIGRSIERKAFEEERIRLYREVQKNYEKILKGLIPICASCKSIRDEEGEWHQLEAYVQMRTEANFTHGICPDCVKKLYPYLDKT